jgi:hypothetical protein
VSDILAVRYGSCRRDKAGDLGFEDKDRGDNSLTAVKTLLIPNYEYYLAICNFVALKSVGPQSDRYTHQFTFVANSYSTNVSTTVSVFLSLNHLDIGLSFSDSTVCPMRQEGGLR